FVRPAIGQKLANRGGLGKTAGQIQINPAEEFLVAGQSGVGDFIGANLLENEFVDIVANGDRLHARAVRYRDSGILFGSWRPSSGRLSRGSGVNRVFRNL